MVLKEQIKSMKLGPIVLKVEGIISQFAQNGECVRIIDCIAVCQQNHHQDPNWLQPLETECLIINGFLMSVSCSMTQNLGSFESPHLLVEVMSMLTNPLWVNIVLFLCYIYGTESRANESS